MAKNDKKSMPAPYAANNDGQHRIVGTPFEKGKSGNPSGRPKALREFQDYARQHSTAVIDVLAKIVLGENEDSKARVMAGKELLDRAWGKSKQEIDAPPGLSESLAALIQAGRKRAGK